MGRHICRCLLGQILTLFLIAPVDLYAQTQLEAEAALTAAIEDYDDLMEWYDDVERRATDLAPELSEAYNALDINDWTPTEWLAINNIYAQGNSKVSGAQGQLGMAATSLDNADQHIGSAWFVYYVGAWAFVVQEVAYANSEMFDDLTAPNVPQRLEAAEVYLDDGDVILAFLWSLSEP